MRDEILCRYPIKRAESGPCQTCDDGYEFWGEREHGILLGEIAVALGLPRERAHAYLGPVEEVCGHSESDHDEGLNARTNEEIVVCVACLREHDDWNLSSPAVHAFEAVEVEAK